MTWAACSAPKAKNAQAESEARQALTLRARLLGRDEQQVAEALAELVYALQTQRKFAEAEQLLQEYVTPEAIISPQGGEFQMIGIEYHARRQQWAAAAAAAEQAVQSHPLDHRFYHMLAPLLVKTHELTRYQELCRKILAKFGGVTDPFIADRMAKDCLLLPSAGVNLTLVNKLAETAVYEGQGAVALPNFHTCKALAEFRLGNFARAVEWANKARDTPFEDARAMACCVLALAHARLQEMTEARAALAAAAEIVDKQLSRRETDDWDRSWQGWIFARELMDQARAMIDPAPAVLSSAPRPEAAERRADSSSPQVHPGAAIR